MIDPARPDFWDTPVAATRPGFDYSPADPSAPPCVSIVTPFRNTGEVFRETVRSVFGQSLQQWEWIIVNDGSSEPDSLAMLEPLRHGDDRIRVIDLPGGRGASAARNAGFAAARAPYVFQLDSDDLIEPTTVEKCWWFLESYPEFGFVKGYNVGFGASEYLSPHGFDEGALFLQRNPTSITAMVRKSAHAAVGGYDESNSDGLEDWEFWLACANAGLWGATIPEYLDWYRRRDDHATTWTNWDEGDAQAGFERRLRARYPALWQPGGFPHISPAHHLPNAAVSDALPGDNRLTKPAPRLLMILPWLTMGGSDKFNLDLAEHLTRRGWQITIATTVSGDHSWMPQFTRRTPDVFALHHFLRLVDYPRFLRYLLRSRQPDVVMVSNSEVGYGLLPYLRASAPDAAFVDFVHMEEEYWKSGGYPAMSVRSQECLDLNIALSHHLRGWMIERGADPKRTVVCHSGVDLPDPPAVEAARKETRARLGISENTAVILYAGRLCSQKQPEVYAETMRRLASTDGDWIALVAGSGPDFAGLQAFLQRHHLTRRVRLLGAVSPGEMPGVMAACDVFFLPSKWEGIALVLFEAMASSRPVVGADVGGQKELVTSECGVLLDASGPLDAQADAYAAALSELLSDSARVRQLGRNSRLRIEQGFRLEDMTDRLLGAFALADSYRRANPRGAVPIGVGRHCANQTVEYERMQQLADGLWLGRNAGQASAVVMPVVRRAAWRTAALLVSSKLEPAYSWGLKRGWGWLVPLRQRLRAAVLGSQTAGNQA
jgi:glycosyltransferase involved in cell wall biosynthesis